jgi:EAL domain-containing protein (putative c-di-GMP-specific phosphodiesterase class I)
LHEWIAVTTSLLLLNAAIMVFRQVRLYKLQECIERKRESEDRFRVAFLISPELPNRRLLNDRLKQAIASSARNERYGALLFIDLDKFKEINDTLGHAMGDLLLQQTTLRLMRCVRDGDTVAQLGGDEFLVLMETQSESRQDAAGRNTLRFFEPEMQATVAARAALESDLHHAIQNQQFLLYYQAQVDRSGLVTGAEALLRWEHPLRGLVSPLEFIPLAEDNGLIIPIGDWVIETACAQLSAWSKRPEMCQLRIAVNVSASQFSQADFVEKTLAILEQTGANPALLKMELTESMLVSCIEDVIAKMRTLKAIGVGFALDDFGTGYSSLSYLKRLPLDQLKIDQLFVKDILTDANDAAIAKMVIALAGSMGLDVIAEGVETAPQRDFLALQGCQVYQGYLFSKAIPLQEFEEFASRV